MNYDDIAFADNKGMNLSKLFEIQKQLDERIVRQHGLQGEDLLPKKILALQVELGELANEWRGFKFWSERQSPTISQHISHTDGSKSFRNPLLEEYVDCLHFILSIGIEANIQIKEIRSVLTSNVLDGFSNIFTWVFRFTHSVLEIDKMEYYGVMVDEFIQLGEMLGFTWEQIEQAYLDKNKVNHKRQEAGY